MGKFGRVPHLIRFYLLVVDRHKLPVFYVKDKGRYQAHVGRKVTKRHSPQTLTNPRPRTSKYESYPCYRSQQGKSIFVKQRVKTVVVVQGLGLAVARAVLVAAPDTVVLLGCRDLVRGEVAVHQLETELGCQDRLLALQLDVTSQVSENYLNNS